MDGAVLLPYRPKNPFFAPTRGGILDGLDEAPSGSGLELFLSPEEIAGIDGLVNQHGSEQPVQDFGPRPLEARDNSLSGMAGDKSSGSHSNGIVEGEYGGPPNPFDKTGEDRGSVAAKIWNLPNSAIGAAYGGLGYLAGWPSKWLGLQEGAPGITTGNNAIQFTHNPLMAPDAAITLGNVQIFHGKPTDHPINDPTTIGEHEEQHTYQGEQLGPLYLPSNILGGLAAELVDGYWHGPHNWNEVGPRQPTPVPWQK
jgi:hypothetical protein